MVSAGHGALPMRQKRSRRGAAATPRGAFAVACLCASPALLRQSPASSGLGFAGRPTVAAGALRPSLARQQRNPRPRAEAHCRQIAATPSAASAEFTGSSKAGARFFSCSMAGAAAAAAAARAARAAVARAAGGAADKGANADLLEGELEIGTAVMVVSPSGKERRCTVVDSDDHRLKVHYEGFSEEYDEWLPIGDGRIGEVVSRPTKGQPQPAVQDEGDWQREMWGDSSSSKAGERGRAPPEFEYQDDESQSSYSAAFGDVEEDDIPIGMGYDNYEEENAEKELKYKLFQSDEKKAIKKNLRLKPRNGRPFQDALAAVISMDVLEDEEIDAVMMVLTRRSFWPEAREVMKAMLANGKAPGGRMYRGTAAAVLKSNYHDKHHVLLDMIDEMKANDLEVGIEMYRCAMNGCIAAGASESGVRIYDYMQADKDIKPEFRSYLLGIQACERDGLLTKAIEIFEDLLEAGKSPDVMMFNSMIRTCGKAGNYEKAMTIFEQMEDADIQPNGGTYIAMMEMCLGTRRYDQAKEFARDIADQNFLKPYDYSKLIALHVASREGEIAMEWFDKAMLERLSLPIETYGGALRALKQLGDGERALSLLMEVKCTCYLSTHRPGLVTSFYISTIDACAKAGLFGELADLPADFLQETHVSGRKGWLAGMLGYRTQLFDRVVSVLVEHKQVHDLLGTLRDAQQEDVFLSTEVLRSALACLKSAGIDYESLKPWAEKNLANRLKRLDDASGIAERFEDLGVRSKKPAPNKVYPDGAELMKLRESMREGISEASVKNYSLVINRLKSEGMLQEAIQAYDEMRSKDIEPDERIARVVIMSMERAEMWEDLLQAFELAKERSLLGGKKRRLTSAAITACRRTGQQERARELEDELEQLRQKKSESAKEVRA